jgi:hypothetical protein
VTRPTNDELARALLGTFSHDEVPAPSRERAFAAFGIPAGVASVPLAAIGAVAQGASVVAPTATIAAKGVVAVGGFSVVKAAIAGAAIGVAVMHAGDRLASYSRDTRASSPPAATPRANAPAPPSPAVGVVENAEPAPRAARPLTSVRVSQAVEVDPPPAIARAVVAPPAPVEPSRQGAPSLALPAGRVATHPGAGVASAPEETPPATTVAPSPNVAERPLATLTDEVVRLDRARSALRDGSPSRAMWELDGYDAEFANGSLRQEATVLRIELLVATGNDARARTLAETFATAHPRSGYLSRIRELLARRPTKSAP